MYADDFTNERIALSCGDVFSGLIISEPGFYKRVPAKAAHSFWEPNFSAPPGEVLGKAKQRALILVKEKPDDFFAAVVKAFTNDGFKRVTTMHPATHETLHYPNFDPEFVRKAIEFMDAPAKPQAGATTRGK
jgi:hypothetical protein